MIFAGQLLCIIWAWHPDRLELSKLGLDDDISELIHFDGDTLCPNLPELNLDHTGTAGFAMFEAEVFICFWILDSCRQLVHHFPRL